MRTQPEFRTCSPRSSSADWAAGNNYDKNDKAGQIGLKRSAPTRGGRAAAALVVGLMLAHEMDINSVEEHG